jgi:ribosome biogenesis GTPase / thiamine phosphate phosphatase
MPQLIELIRIKSLLMLLLLLSRRVLGFSSSTLSTSRLLSYSRSLPTSTSRLFSEKRKNERIKSWRKTQASSASPTATATIVTTAPKGDIVDASLSTLSMEPDLLDGLVIERQGDRLIVELLSPVSEASSKKNSTSVSDPYVLCSQRTSLTSANIVVGDVISLRLLRGRGRASDSEDDNDGGSSDISEGVAIACKERKNILERPVASNPNSLQFKYIASNIDHMFIVTSSTPTVPLITIDRYLVIAHLLGMGVTIILNKNDLSTTNDYYSSISHYPALGYDIHRVSNTGEGVAQLIAQLANKTSIFVGQSGVGKSSLINRILPLANIRTGGLTQKINMGSHTTSNARLYHVDCGDGHFGNIIDSPGIREFGLWHLDPKEIAEGFPEIYEASRQCKFRNCKHSENEVGCAVRARYEAGLINKYRLKHYFELTS